MWPWEHLAVGYLAYSLSLRALGREPPAGDETLLLAVGTQLPDLVDKPLSWGLALFPSGFAVAHSAFVAVPVGLLALAVGARRGRDRAAVAGVLGYWSHLAGDVLSPLRAGDPPGVGRVLWPAVRARPYAADLGLRRGLVYLEGFLAGLPGAAPSTLALLAALPLAALAVWVADGRPGPGALRRLLARAKGAATRGKR